MSWLLLAALISVNGTVCRMNRAIDRLIVSSDNGPRVRVSIPSSVSPRYRAHDYDRADLRPGDRVHIEAERSRSEGLRAQSIEVTMRVDDALFDSIFRSHRTVTGRFAVREGKSDFFSLHLPNRRYVRVDAKSAYGPDGRVRVASLKSGDLLEVHGTWPTKDLLKATSVTVLTDHEPSFCTSEARRGEESADTAAREADEKRFLDKVISDDN
ncbi:MAG TPA: hypothetical protein VL284_15115 [Thermoanaerobaculia bacterium]|nr:hypothetical protein [Thermoanaerobaculia bacterium]